VSYEFDPAAFGEFAGKMKGLPEDARRGVDHVLRELASAPWTSHPMNEANPAGQYRFVPFDVTSGYGWVTFVVMETEHRVSLVNLLWFPSS